MKSSLSDKLSMGDGRSTTVEDVTVLYRNLVNVSKPTQGNIQKLGQDSYSLKAKFEALDCDTRKSIETVKVYSLTTDNNTIENVRCVSDAHEVGSLTATSPNGRYLARLRKETKDKDEKQYLEIWDRARHIKTIVVPELDIHGSICTSFSSLTWCPYGEQDKLLYVCQPKQPKHLAFFSESGQADTKRGEEFLRKEDWGERLTGIEHTMIGFLDVGNGCKISTIDVDDYSICYPKWLDKGDKIVAVAHKESPRRLGITFCNNRPTKIVVFNLLGDLYMDIDELSSHSPRVNNDGDKFVFLTNKTFGPHRQSEQLMICDLNSKSVRPLKGELFVVGLTENCFTSDDKFILVVIQEYLQHQMVLISLDEPFDMVKLKFPTTGLSVLDFRHDIILACGSSINTTPTLFVALLNPKDVQGVVAWHQIEDCIHMDEVDYECFKIEALDDDNSFISAILITSNLQDSRIKSDQLPTVVLLHGGPCGADDLSYRMSPVLNAKLGLNTLQVNYRGSTGVDQAYLNSLCGRAGERDVNDCLHAIRHLCQTKKIDRTKLIVQGGSHGGFLAAHLSCQEEFKFTSAILRNPVIDISVMFSITDIPDWCLTVALNLNNYDAASMPNTFDFDKMYKSSPISKVNKANVPTLMLLGNKDRRVPMSQGERWVNILRARGVEVVCKVYDDNHSLLNADVSIDQNISTVIWMLSHLHSEN